MELLTTNSGQLLIAIFVAINIFSLVVMGYDKHTSIKGNGTERTPEGIIFFIAAVFGSIGVYIGMLGFRHKTKKWYFQIGIPLLILQNITTAYVIWDIVIEI
jgi:uncharacterized membrane protein YsdA (DUF1294 family)